MRQRYYIRPDEDLRKVIEAAQATQITPTQAAIQRVQSAIDAVGAEQTMLKAEQASFARNIDGLRWRLEKLERSIAAEDDAARAAAAARQSLLTTLH